LQKASILLFALQKAGILFSALKKQASCFNKAGTFLLTLEKHYCLYSATFCKRRCSMSKHFGYLSMPLPFVEGIGFWNNQKFLERESSKME